MSNKCPKCNTKLSPFYLKPTCPKCGINLMQYDFDKRLEEDKEKAENEWKKAEDFLTLIKSSTVSSPVAIIRLVLFFTPLLSMCLPMFYAAHKKVSLISFIMSIVNHGFDLNAIASDKAYLFAILSMIFVIILSLVEIICSLFSKSKNGYKRNITAFSVNFAVLAVISFLSIGFGAKAKIGLTVTFLIYLVKYILHNLFEKKKIDKSNAVILIIVALSIVASVFCMFGTKEEKFNTVQKADCDLSAVTFNVASAFGSSFDDTDSMTRCTRFANYMNQIKPDLIGTQEMNSLWMKKLSKDMDGYDNYAVKRGGDSDEKSSEMTAVFWNKSKFSLIEKDTFWLSETPNKESKYTFINENGEKSEAGCYRICSYVVLLDNKTKLNIIFLNTHLDNSSEQAANFGASVVLNKIDELKVEYDNAHIVLTGDFNETKDGDAYKLVENKLSDCTDLSKQTATYQEWGYCNTENEPIDFIFTSDKGFGYTVLNDLSSGYVSDHYGVYSNIKF